MEKQCKGCKKVYQISDHYGKYHDKGLCISCARDKSFMPNSYAVKNYEECIIYLSSGRECFIDRNDLTRILNVCRWHETKSSSTYYAVGKVNGKPVKMHHFVLPKRKGFDIDHINMNGLDNRRDNLQYLTRSENLRKAPAWSHNTSKHKNIYWSKAAQKWEVSFHGEGKKIYLGIFSTMEEAIKIRDQFISDNH